MAMYKDVIMGIVYGILALVVMYGLTKSEPKSGWANRRKDK